MHQNENRLVYIHSWVISRPFNSSTLLKDAPRCILYAYNTYVEEKSRLQRAFCQSKYITGPELSEQIWQTLLARNKRIAKFKFLTFSLACFISLAGLIPAIKMLLEDFTRSGFYEYISLLFSDRGSLLSYWKEFTFSLLESVPLTSVLLSLTLIFIFFLSLRFAMKQIIRAHISHVSLSI